MKKHGGFTSFEFYLVMAVIGIIMLVGLQRYLQLAEETQRQSFDVLAQHFNTAVYNLRAKWMLSLQVPDQNNIVETEGALIQFSQQGWPMSEAGKQHSEDAMDADDCLFLWHKLLQNPAPISYPGGEAYGSRAYHLSVTNDGHCRFELLTKKNLEYYFDYSARTGQVMIHTPPISKNSE